MAEERIVRLNEMTPEDQEKCIGCSANVLYSGEKIPVRLCEIAKLQKNLGKKPKLSQVAAERIDIESIPNYCPNGY